MASPAARINSYLAARRSPLAGHGADFVRWGRRYGVDPMLMVAISGAETSFGTYGPSQRIHNAWGIGPGQRFSSWGAGIQGLARLLRENYLDKGYKTLPAIGGRYVYGSETPMAPGANWLNNVQTFLGQLGSDGGSPASGGGRAAGPSRGGRVSLPQANLTPIQTNLTLPDPRAVLAGLGARSPDPQTDMSAPMPTLPAMTDGAERLRALRRQLLEMPGG